MRKNAGDLGGEAGGRDVTARRRPRRAVADKAAALCVSDYGQRGRHGMGAALGASGHMDRDAGAQPRELRRKRCRNPARIDVTGRAGWRAGTGGDATARVGGGHDETELLRCGGERRRIPWGNANQHQHTVRGRADRPRAMGGGDASQFRERISRGVTERKGEPQRQRTVAQKVPSHHLRRWPRRWGWQGLDIESGAESLDASCTKHIRCSGGRPTRGDLFQESEHDIGRLLRRNGAEPHRTPSLSSRGRVGDRVHGLSTSATQGASAPSPTLPRKREREKRRLAPSALFRAREKGTQRDP